MAEGDMVVALNLRWSKVRFGKQFVEKRTAARTCLTINKPNTSSSQVFRLPNPLRIAWFHYQAFFPLSKGNDENFFARKLLPNIRQVELTRLRILEMGACDVDLA